MKKIALLVAALCVLSTSSVQAQAITVYNATNGEFHGHSPADGRRSFEYSRHRFHLGHASQ